MTSAMITMMGMRKHRVNRRAFHPLSSREYAKEAAKVRARKKGFIENIPMPITATK